MGFHIESKEEKMFRDTTYIIIIIVVVDILCVLFSGFALMCSQKEKGEKSMYMGSNPHIY